MDDFASLARLVAALAPWRGQLVIVGGWAHRLHRLHPLAGMPAYQPLMTKDTDLAFADGVPLEGNIRSALIAAGFGEELSGDHKPPVSKYTLGDDDAGFYAEFLTPLRGSGVKRSGKADATLLMAGITAQKLRNLEILLLDPWPIRHQAWRGNRAARADNRIDVQVCNPVSFIAQKMLIHGDRKPVKRAQDILYIHDTIELFAAASEQLKDEWMKVVRPALDEQSAKLVTENTRQLFSGVTDLIRQAVLIPRDRNLTPEILRARCELGLAQMFSL